MNVESEQKRKKAHTSIKHKVIISIVCGIKYERKKHRDHVPLWLCFGVKDSCKYSQFLLLFPP